MPNDVQTSTRESPPRPSLQDYFKNPVKSFKTIKIQKQSKPGTTSENERELSPKSKFEVISHESPTKHTSSPQKDFFNVHGPQGLEGLAPQYTPTKAARSHEHDISLTPSEQSPRRIFVQSDVGDSVSSDYPTVGDSPRARYDPKTAGMRISSSATALPDVRPTHRARLTEWEADETLQLTEECVSSTDIPLWLQASRNAIERPVDPFSLPGFEEALQIISWSRKNELTVAQQNFLCWDKFLELDERFSRGVANAIEVAQYVILSYCVPCTTLMQYMRERADEAHLKEPPSARVTSIIHAISKFTDEQLICVATSRLRGLLCSETKTNGYSKSMREVYLQNGNLLIHTCFSPAWDARWAGESSQVEAPPMSYSAARCKPFPTTGAQQVSVPVA